ncbi:MAG: hypothetical protein JWM52_527 [Candidatus Saccharibacteria bacterium]|nr:hypothetical protein [Candidatus Saccharibacteria bacterium]
MTKVLPLISIVVPVFNEGDGIRSLYNDIKNETEKLTQYNWAILFVDDGSTDASLSHLEKIAASDDKVSVLALSRNFGKEYALTAGITFAQGDAIVTLDGDGQHPVESIGKFVEQWEKGFQVVIGVRKEARLSRSNLFYALFNRMSGEHLTAGATDYRLIDKVVKEEFVQLAESGRITRGLIDWLGFKRTSVWFTPKKRQFGKPTYSTKQLLRLAVHSFISLSSLPLYIFGGLGVAITTLSGLLGITVIIEQVILEDPLNWNFTGTAMLGILILFLIGIVLMAQGVVSLYISAIHRETKHRPLYIVDRSKSKNLK